MDCIKIHIKKINLKVKWKWKELKKMKNQKKNIYNVFVIS